jgi:ribonuclease P protein component
VSRKAFEIIMKEGKVYFSYPLRVVWQKTDNTDTFPAKVAFSVPKRKYKRANQRNLAKRRMREAYRLHKHMLYDVLENNVCHVNILIVYIGSDILSYHEIEKKTIGLFNHIVEHIKKDAE